MIKRRSEHRIEVVRQDQAMVLRLSSRFEHDFEERGHLVEVVTELVDDGERYFVLDLLRLPYLESAIREIMVCFKRIREKDGKLALAVRRNTRDWLEVLQFHQIFAVADSVDLAVSECRS